MDWIDVAQDRPCQHDNESLGFIKRWEKLE
jgi:hypothetical protein